MNEPISGEKAAFPWPKDQSQHLFSLGMTLRDYFAAAALKGQAHRFAHPHEYRELLAQDCYDIADAMIKAREAKP